jgi:glycosyltransferase involved in cell wall biosynthesis
LRIAFHSTIPNHAWGGADTLWTRAAEAASERGDELLLSISTVVAAHPRIKALVLRGADLALVEPFRPAAGLPERALRKLQSSLKSATDPVTAALQRWKPDLVIVSCGGTCDVATMPALCTWLVESGIRFRIIANFQFQNLHLEDPERERVSRVFEAADALCFVSTHNLQLTQQYLLLPLPNAAVLHNPLRWVSGDARPWPATQTWNIATVSRLSHTKGIHLLLHAAAQALPRGSDWKIHIFGRGSEDAYLRSVAKHTGLDAHVHFMGHVDDLASVWDSNHVLASPAIDEGVPMTIPEAMLCGRGVLATRVGGATDWLRDGETGFLCPAPTVPLLAEALDRAWQARDRWQSMGEAAAEFARAFYRPEDFRRLIAFPFLPPIQMTAIDSVGETQ